ncbi:unnamed protein product [Rangifer tarandus platyrhynchus]|uniref:Uncharacterized protein n=1 Tax=Rangifer tarandus platyrhynchus TaxID=3082113 RepID=A0AC59YLS4_RANTA
MLTPTHTFSILKQNGRKISCESTSSLHLSFERSKLRSLERQRLCQGKGKLSVLGSWSLVKEASQLLRLSEGQGAVESLCELHGAICCADLRFVARAVPSTTEAMVET